MLRYDRNLLPVDWGLHESKFAPTINQRPGITRIRGVSRYLRPVPLFKPKRFTITLSCVVALKWGRVFHASDLQYECQGNTNRWRETRLLDKRHTPSTPNYISYLFKRMITGIKKRGKWTFKASPNHHTTVPNPTFVCTSFPPSKTMKKVPCQSEHKPIQAKYDTYTVL